MRSVLCFDYINLVAACIDKWYKDWILASSSCINAYRDIVIYHIMEKGSYMTV